MGLYDDPRHLLKPLMSDYKGTKRAELIRSAVAEVMKHAPKRLQKLVQLMSWMGGQFAQAKVQAHIIQLADELVSEFYSQGWNDLVFTLLELRNGPWGDKRDARINWPNFTGYDLFVNRCHRYIGERSDRSLRFAYELMERYSRCSLQLHAQIQDGRTDLDLAEQVFYTAFVHHSFSLPPIWRFATKLWLERVIEVAGEGNEAAAETLIDLYLIMHGGSDQAGNKSASTDVEWVPYADKLSPAEEETILAELAPDALQYQHLASPMRVHFHERHMAMLEKVLQDDQAICQQIKQEGARLLDWVIEHYDTLSAKTATKLREIREVSGKPKRMLRPYDLDRVEVDVLLLRGVGVREIIFDAAGTVFPDVGVKVLVRKDTPNYYMYRTTVSGVRNINPDALRNLTFQDTDLLQFVLHIITVDALHRIVIGGNELREKRPKGSSPKTVRRTVRIKRAHIRHLPETQTPSEEALARGREAFGCEFAPGVTFVRAYERDGVTVRDLPNEAFASYDIDDLTELLH